jgi:urate oxidase
MPIAAHSYGKAGVRMVKVKRDSAQHQLRDLTVSIQLHGPFDASYIDGDNRNVLPTDTMKNTVYALGKDHPIDSIESFALHLGRHFLSQHDHIEAAEVEIIASSWNQTAEHAFVRSGPECDVCEIRVERDDTIITAGIDELTMLKTSDSSFRDFLHDELTTLKDADERVLGTSITARWDYETADPDFNTIRAAVRETLVQTFAHHESLSVQHTLYAMGNAILEHCPAVARIALSMPNQHYLLVDLSSLGRTNDNEIFMPVDEPYGVIEAVIER